MQRLQSLGRVAAFMSVCLPFAACGAPAPITPGVESLTLEMQHEPSIKSSNGRTVVLIDFVTRLANRTPLDPAELNVELAVDDQPLDTESLLDQHDSRLKVDLNLHLVLDASFSMLSQPVEAPQSGLSNGFELMLDTAAKSRSRVREIWKSKSQDALANVGITFFDKWIYQTVGEWSDAQIVDFPDPSKGTETKLLGAAHFAATQMKVQYDGGLAAGERDRHVLLLFTDGHDNISTLDNTDTAQAPCTGFCSTSTTPICQSGSLVPNCPNMSEGLCHTPTQHGAFTSSGYPCVDRQAVADAFLAHRTLETHVLGIGTQVDEDELTYLANQGRGGLLLGTAADDIPKLFEDVLKEFATVDARGADIPQPLGSYRFSIAVTQKGEPHARVKCYFYYQNNPDGVDALQPEFGDCVSWPPQ